MKKFTTLCLILLLAFAIVFGMTACDDGDSEQATFFEITVDTANVSVDTSQIKVCLYPLDGTGSVLESQPTGGVARFRLQADSYVATVSGLDEKVSFSSVLITHNSEKAKITLSNSKYDDLMDLYSYKFTVIMQNGDYKLGDISAQFCDQYMCSEKLNFVDSLAVDVTVGSASGDECEVKAFYATAERPDDNPLFYEKFSLDLDKRFYVIRL